jgi:excisionase family DNA binding protein
MPVPRGGVLKVEAILCSQAEAGKVLAIGKTKLGELITQGELETIRIGARRLVKIASIRRLAGVEPDQQGETK